ncbi:efflux RND transporter periplasmic adaptor subunit [Aureimonas leprariae]|uniref:efflux RND transporter periplasmic adaptor subunit n=1 Tax=Plantimonas leprariae TaxID=2615207 RepID=UPI001FE425EB|nr:efflux RND transporter periplasmic adaptor subunit [Aureimonas leprariae]
MILTVWAAGSAFAQGASGNGQGEAKPAALAQNNQTTGAGSAAPSAPPPEVTVATVEAKRLPITFEYAARVEASREVEVRARVAGILTERSFVEGSAVKQDQVLFRIDPREFEAEVARADAAVQQADAQLANARQTEDRVASLARTGASSKASLDDATATRKLAEAQLASAKAQLDTANLSLTYATVTAPVGGITSREQFPEGSLVSVNTLLTRVSQLDPIYVNFSAADTEAFQIRRLIQEGIAGGANNLSAQVSFGDGNFYNETGKIDFTSAAIDPATGTISSRAVFPNPGQQLLPGQFVRVVINGLAIDDAIQIPATALMQNPQGQFVYTVGDDNVAKVRPIEVGRELNETIIVAKGLNSGDRVVTDGVVKVRPDTPVKPMAAPDPHRRAEADEGTAAR